MAAIIEGARSISFTVPAGAGSYDTAVVYLKDEPDKIDALWHPVSELTLVVESLPAGAQIEIDLLKPGTDPKTASNWLINQQTHTAIGLKSLLQMARWRGVRIRAKSGGTGGASVVHATWW